MSVAPQDILKHLSATKLFSTAEIEQLRSRLNGGPIAESPETVLKELVEQKRLTRFQSKAILQGKGAGLVIGNYLVLDKLGEGGMGVVFKAQHSKMQRLVALKVLYPRVSKEANMIKRFRQEVHAVARLMHPNIVTALDADEVGGLHFLVMEYVDGIDLKRYVETNGPLSVQTALQYLLQAARGLQHAHEAGVIHRDIKPSNLLVDRKGHVKVLDLGLARLTNGMGDENAHDQLTKTGIIMGSVDYMSPEQAFDTKRVDHRCDIYGLGCTLHYFLTGKVVFNADSMLKTLLAHREQKPPNLRDKRPDVSARVDALFQKLMAKLPESRYASMRDVELTIESCLSGLGTSAATTAAPQIPVAMENSEPAVERSERSSTASAPTLFAVEEPASRWSWAVTTLSPVLAFGLLIVLGYQWLLPTPSGRTQLDGNAAVNQTRIHQAEEPVSGQANTEINSPPVSPLPASQPDREIQLDVN